MNIAPPRFGGSTIKPQPKHLPLLSTPRLQPVDRIRPGGERIRPSRERTRSSGNRTHPPASPTKPPSQPPQSAKQPTQPVHKPITTTTTTTTTKQTPQHAPLPRPHRKPLPSIPTPSSTFLPRHGYVPTCGCYQHLGYYHVGGECVTFLPSAVSPTAVQEREKEGKKGMGNGDGDGDETMRGRARFRSEEREGKRERERERERERCCERECVRVSRR